jgi:hypothetical protein
MEGKTVSRLSLSVKRHGPFGSLAPLTRSQLYKIPQIPKIVNSFDLTSCFCCAVSFGVKMREKMCSIRRRTLSLKSKKSKEGLMRGKISIFLALILAVGLCVLSTLAKAEEQKAEGYLVWDVLVKPSMASQYEALSKEEVSLYAEGKFAYPWYTYSTEDFHYFYVFQVENFAAIDKIYKTFAEAEKQMGEKYQSLAKRFVGTYEYVHIDLSYLKPDLSYTPKKPSLKPEESNFIWWGFAYVLPGKEKEFEEVSKEWVALYKSKNIPDGYGTYIGDLGSDMPLYFWVFAAKSLADFSSQDEKYVKMIGEDKVKALESKTASLLRKWETKTGMFRPDLSYIPKVENAKK